MKQLYPWYLDLHRRILLWCFTLLPPALRWFPFQARLISAPCFVSWHFYLLFVYIRRWHLLLLSILCRLLLSLTDMRYWTDVDKWWRRDNRRVATVFTSPWDNIVRIFIDREGVKIEDSRCYLPHAEMKMFALLEMMKVCQLKNFYGNYFTKGWDC